MNLSILLLFLLPHDILSIDYFLACKPTLCGSLPIRYPFYIQNMQESYCGYPGFQVSCLNNKRTIIHLPNDNYYIQNINYDLQTISVINTLMIVDTVFNCSAGLHNLTLDGTMFQFSSKHSEVYFLPNCTEKGRKGIKRSKVVSCWWANGPVGLLAAYGEDVNLSKVTGQCSGVISIPYQGKDEESIDSSIRTGFQLKWSVGNCSDCVDTGGRCGYNTTSARSQCFCFDGPADRCHPSRKHKQLWIVFPALAMGIGVLMIVLYFWLKQRRMNKNAKIFLRNYGSIAPKIYSYAAIRKMTNNFKEKLGQGGFGSVFKGKLDDGRIVAVKLLEKSKGDGDEFMNEVASIGRTNHVNIVTLLGFCFQGHKRALVYEFMPNGPLEKFTYSSSNKQLLPWETFYSISIGIARGLDYLHRGCTTRILHFDIKPHNILLDEEFHPKISDFGLARLCPEKESIISMLGARGTIGYIAPEILFRSLGGASHKSDVYSYGMMVLEMVGAKKNVLANDQQSTEMYFPEWIYKQLELWDGPAYQELMNNEEIELQRKMILVSLWCIQTNPSSRPSMNRVVDMLEGSIDLLQIPPMPSVYLSQRSIRSLGPSFINRIENSFS